VLLSTLGKQGIAVLGKDVKSLFGKMANYIGDINGDEIDDIVVYSTSFQIPKYVIFGTPNSNLDDVATLYLTDNIGFEIQHIDDNVKLTCSALSDINGDGYDDFMIGDMKYNGNRGAVYIVYGRSSFSSILYISTLASNERLVICGSKSNEYFGKYLSSKPGSKSGCFDILTCSNSRCYVISCIQSSYESVVNVDDLLKLDSKYGYTIQGTVISDIKNTMVLSSIGDVNGDGLSDFAISSSSYFSGRGVVYVIFGTYVNNNISSIDLDTLGTSVGIIVTHSRAGAGLGRTLSAVGDVNGDGINDFVIGSYAVEAFVIYGGLKMTNIDLLNLRMNQGYSISISLSQSIVDLRVVGNIDVNHDGISDIAVGCPYDNMAERVYVIFGTNNRYRSNVILASMTSAQGLVIVTSDLVDKSGYYISSAGDYNNDTYRDLLVCAPYALNKVGAVYVITNAFDSDTRSPTLAPNNLPKISKRPSIIPSVKPSLIPSVRPSKSPSVSPQTLHPSILPTSEQSTDGVPTYDPSVSSSAFDTPQPTSNNTHEPVSLPSKKPSSAPSKFPITRRPSLLPTLHPSNLPTNIINTLLPTRISLTISPSLDDTTHHPSNNDNRNNTFIFDNSKYTDNNVYSTISILLKYLGPMIIIAILFLFYSHLKYIYKFLMDKLGYDFRKQLSFDTSIQLRFASLDECIQHFWEYRGVIYKKGTITDDLFTQFEFSNKETILNALDHICMNPNILCPVSYYKVICHMADRKSDAIRNKAYETLIICKSVMNTCVTVECIQLLRHMFIDCGRNNVKEHAVSMLCEISHNNPNLITFDIYDMLRSYKFTTSDMNLSHAIEITLQEIRQYCVHLHTQIDDYEKALLTSDVNDDDKKFEVHQSIEDITNIIRYTDNNNDIDMGKEIYENVDNNITTIVECNNTEYDKVSTNSSRYDEDNVLLDYFYNNIINQFDTFLESKDEEYEYIISREYNSRINNNSTNNNLLPIIVVSHNTDHKENNDCEIEVLDGIIDRSEDIGTSNWNKELDSSIANSDGGSSSNSSSNTTNNNMIIMSSSSNYSSSSEESYYAM
jgi:hypothetical protein